MKILIGVLIILLAVVLAACGSAESTPAPMLELSLMATDIAYDVNRLEAMAGQPVRITLHNEGALDHDFSIMEMPHTGEVMTEEMAELMAGHDMSAMEMEPEIHVATLSGSSNSVEFTPSTPGEYEFFCSVTGHREAGMAGILVVTAP